MSLPATTADPVHVLSLGAGVQSSVMLLMAERGELTPRPAAAIFADTGWEPQDVYDHLDWLAGETSIPITRVSNGRNLREDTMEGLRHDGKTGFLDIPHFIGTPGRAVISKRQCTIHYKITPIQQAARELAGYPRPGKAPPPGAVAMWIGISTDEALRIKPSRVKYVRNEYPLIDAGISRRDCQRWFERNYPGRPLVKSACLGCPFHNARAWVTLYRRGGRNGRRRWRWTADCGSPATPGVPGPARWFRAGSCTCSPEDRWRWRSPRWMRPCAASRNSPGWTGITLATNAKACAKSRRRRMIYINNARVAQVVLRADQWVMMASVYDTEFGDGPIDVLDEKWMLRGDADLSPGSKARVWARIVRSIRGGA